MLVPWKQPVGQGHYLPGRQEAGAAVRFDPLGLNLH